MLVIFCLIQLLLIGFLIGVILFLASHPRNTISGLYSDYDEDNEGQVVIYTGIYHWSDGSYHSEPEEEEDEDA